MTSGRAEKRVAVLQSNYIPWKGYFDLIGLADEFVIYDEVQYTTNDWRNRNRIKTATGLQWLTIPIVHTGRFGQRIDEAETAGSAWRRKHWRALEQAYGSAPHFDTYRGALEPLYLESDATRLSSINRAFITTICALLGIRTPITPSTDYPGGTGRTERLVAICQLSGARRYLSGPAARAYLDEGCFADAGIEVEYMRYDGYPEYPQRGSGFEHAVSVLDVLFNVGPDAPNYMKFFRHPATAGA